MNPLEALRALAFLPWIVCVLVLGPVIEASQVSVLVGSQSAVKPSPLIRPFGIDFDAHNNLFIVELEGGRVHQLTPSGHLTLIAGDGSQGYQGDGGLASQATFNGMHNVAVTPEGDIYISDSWNHCIRKIDAQTEVISTIAGTGQPGYSGDSGPATQATFNYIMCITLNSTNDKLYVADLKNYRIRLVDLKEGWVRTVAGNGRKGIPQDGSSAVDSPLIDPRAVAVDSKNHIYILERGGHSLRVVNRKGKIQTVAGTGQKGFRDGPALQAQFNSPKHIGIDAEDNVFIADDQNHAVRKFNAGSGMVTTVLGRGRGSPEIQLKQPHGVCVENGMLYVVDSGNNRILRVAQFE